MFLLDRKRHSRCYAKIFPVKVKAARYTVINIIRDFRIEYEHLLSLYFELSLASADNIISYHGCYYFVHQT